MDPIPNLMEAARAGNISGLYEAIKKYPNVLKEFDEIQFVNTPLHEAASARQTNFAIEMIRLVPSFGRKLNPDGLSPLDLAVINNHYETVRRLVSFDGELVRVKGKEGLTPLHRAAESDDKIGCLIELLRACPPSIEDLTIRDETALHIAMNSSSGAETFKILYEWVSRARGGQAKRLLQKKDAAGKSAEAYHSQQPKVDKSLQSVETETPSPPANADANTSKLYKYLHTPEPYRERKFRRLLQNMIWIQRDLTLDMRNVVLVVAVLVASATFQSIFTVYVPEGLENHHNNSSLAKHKNNILLYSVSNNWFFSLNTITFIFSVDAIIILLPLRGYTVILHLSLLFMQGCYWSSLNWILSPVVTTANCIMFLVYPIVIHYFKYLFQVIVEPGRPGSSWLLSSRWKHNFCCLHQMGAFTLK